MPVAAINADEQHVLVCACEAAAAGYVDPILIGDEGIIRSLIKCMDCTRQFRIAA